MAPHIFDNKCQVVAGLNDAVERIFFCSHVLSISIRKWIVKATPFFMQPADDQKLSLQYLVHVQR
eukprot:6178497-Pleurochrysis_carterae.AAC.1